MTFEQAIERLNHVDGKSCPDRCVACALERFAEKLKALEWALERLLVVAEAERQAARLERFEDYSSNLYWSEKGRGGAAILQSRAALRSLRGTDLG